MLARMRVAKKTGDTSAVPHTCRHLLATKHEMTFPSTLHWTCAAFEVHANFLGRDYLFAGRIGSSAWLLP